MTTWTEAKIARHIGSQTLSRKCLVLVDNCNWTGYECDVLAVTQDLRIIDIEVKISRGDARADAYKDKWWITQGWGHYTEDLGVRRHVLPTRTHRDWPPKVWKHYYAMPADIWTPDLIPKLASPASGILLLSERNGRVSVKCQRRSTPNRDATKISAAHALDIARLANLRMWAAYDRAETLAAKLAAHHEAQAA
ncbi:MAG: hypothetical protein V4792_09835 [Pseudomonadota bacterium]